MGQKQHSFRGPRMPLAKPLAGVRNHTPSTSTSAHTTCFTTNVTHCLPPGRFWFCYFMPSWISIFVLRNTYSAIIWENKCNGAQEFLNKCEAVMRHAGSRYRNKKNCLHTALGNDDMDRRVQTWKEKCQKYGGNCEKDSFMIYSINRSNRAATPHSLNIASTILSSTNTTEILQERAPCSMTNLVRQLSLWQD